MTASHALQFKAWLLAGGALLEVAQPAARAAEGVEGITAVASKVSDDYIRTKLPDGSFQPENYAFGDGGKWGGEISDSTIDQRHFFDVARVIAVPLAARRFYPATDSTAASRPRRGGLRVIRHQRVKAFSSNRAGHGRRS